MNRVIHKFPINRIRGSEHLALVPESARILKVDYQGAQLNLWAEVIQGDRTLIQHNFMVMPTGIEINSLDYSRMEYIDTVYVDAESKALVLHVYRLH